MKLVGRTRGLADRGGRREGLVLRGLRRHKKRVSWGTGGGVEAGYDWQAAVT
jgi:hypothetical protein